MATTLVMCEYYIGKFQRSPVFAPLAAVSVLTNIEISPSANPIPWDQAFPLAPSELLDQTVTSALSENPSLNNALKGYFCTILP